MGRLLSVAALVALLCIEAGLVAQPSHPVSSLPNSEAADAYPVYSALTRKIVGTVKASKVLLILDYTNGGPGDPSCLNAGQQGSYEYSEQIRRFLEINKTSYRLVPRFDIWASLRPRKYGADAR